jgi:hypothetical protein
MLVFHVVAMLMHMHTHVYAPPPPPHTHTHRLKGKHKICVNSAKTALWVTGINVKWLHIHIALTLHFLTLYVAHMSWCGILQILSIFVIQ